ncbi:MAG TPA: hypothetical protein VJ783_07805, partial [Pirellulales bacterium]|nr:hypothetical protein [Pirellulales bacterium]
MVKIGIEESPWVPRHPPRRGWHQPDARHKSPRRTPCGNRSECRADERIHTASVAAIAIPQIATSLALRRMPWHPA